MTPIGTNPVAGVRIRGNLRQQGRTFEVHEVFTGALLATVAGASVQDTLDAVKAASSALPTWADADPSMRSDRLRAAAQALRQETDSLASMITRETGKRISEAEAEVAFSAAFFEWFADAARCIPDRYLRLSGRRFLVQHVPVGVVAVMTPWNFPLSIPARKIGAALAAGCTAVFKPSEIAPLTGLRLAEIVDEIVPSGVLNTVTGDAEKISETLIGTPEVRAISFTGSTAVGRHVATRAGKHLKRIVLELGGRAPFIVLPGADLGHAADTLMIAKYRNNGESCIAANNVFVHADCYDEFERMISDRSQQMTLGDPADRSTDLGPIINERQQLRLKALVGDAEANGCSVTAFTEPPPGAFVAPTLIENARLSEAWTAEIFGPIIAMETFTDESVVIEEINSWPEGLGGYVCGPPDAELVVAERLQIGIIGLGIGSPNTPEVPFGGFRDSGVGVEGSIEGMTEFLQARTLALRDGAR